MERDACTSNRSICVMLVPCELNSRLVVFCLLTEWYVLFQELLKMFNESGSFYYSLTGDLSNTMQRLYDGSIDKHLPIWDQVISAAGFER